MNILVVNKKWKIIVRSDKVHDSRYPDCHAIAIMDDRKIHVRKSSLNETTVIHELIHAYCYELSFHELQLDDDQVEEFYAELFAKYGKQILQDAKRAVDGIKNKNEKA